MSVPLALLTEQTWEAVFLVVQSLVLIVFVVVWVFYLFYFLFCFGFFCSFVFETESKLRENDFELLSHPDLLRQGQLDFFFLFFLYWFFADFTSCVPIPLILAWFLHSLGRSIGLTFTKEIHTLLVASPPPLHLVTASLLLPSHLTQPAIGSFISPRDTHSTQIQD